MRRSKRIKRVLNLETLFFKPNSLCMSHNKLRQSFATVTLLCLCFLSACSLFKSSSASINKKVPSSYEAKATNSYQQAMLDYVNRFKEIAMREQTRVGIPASVTLAQGLLESNAGRSDLAQKGNNHFGIKCHADWQGGTYYLVDDDRDATGALIKSCFRMYNSPEESYVAHSEFLHDPKKVQRYGSLFNYPPTDYENWSQGLVRAGYATDPTYGDRLIKLIEDYQLHDYDLKTPSGLPTAPVANNGTGYNQNYPNGVGPSAPTGTVNGGGNYNNNYPSGSAPTTPSGTVYNNGYNPNAPSGTTVNPNYPSGYNPNYPNNSGMNTGVSVPNLPATGVINGAKYVRAYGGISLEQIAARNNISLSNLLEYNDNTINPSIVLPEGTVVFIQSKRSYSGAEQSFVRVVPCQTMADIAQQYGVGLEKLYSRNKMIAGDQPMVGEKISLRRGWFEKIDKPQLRDTTGEWYKCHPNMNYPGSNVANRPTGNGSGLDFDISPRDPSNPQNSTGYVVPQPGSTTGTVTYDNQPNYNTPPSYPNSTTTTYPSSSYPSSAPPITTYQGSGPAPVGTIVYDNPNSNTNTQPTSTYPSSSYPSSTYPSTAPATTTYPSSTYPSTTPRPTYPSNTYPSTTPRPTYPATKPTYPATATKPAPVSVRPAIPTPVVTNASTHVVQPGETLWRISKMFNVPVPKLQALNGLTDNNIRIGQTLRIK